jgi:glucose uptake protein
MFSIHNHVLAVCFCVVTMLGWGSWANTLKLSTRRGWPFELYYWDYALGMMLSCLAIAATLGNYGSSGTGAFASIAAASTTSIVAALLSGLLFNLSNVLIVVATDLAGIAIAFPVAVGLAVVIGTSVTYLQDPSGRALPLFCGLGLVVLAMVLSGIASSLQGGLARTRSLRGIFFAVLSGCIMGFFFPRLAASIGQGGSSSHGSLTPYAAAVIFTLSLLVSNLVINTVLIRVRGESYTRYFSGSPGVHLAGVAGGAVWMVALISNLLASSVAGPAVSYALGQGATLVAALWGVFLGKEFKGSPARVIALLGLMFVSYSCGLALIGTAAF